ncbi:hypothetical protein ABFX02_06G040100 [Erythranthe guttata]
MGKDWLHWIIGGGGGGGRSSARRRRRTASGEMEEAAATSAGCMCAVFHLFDMHHFHRFPLNHQTSAAGFRPTINPSLHEEATTSKVAGAEAPRNSLEVEEAEPIAAINAASSSKPLPIKEEANLNFPIGIQIIKTPRVSISGPKSRRDEFSSESSCNSPGIKTPTLVARLMGLDLLPSQSNSPSKPTPKTKQSSNRAFLDHDFGADIRSLPETPRVSSARRSDVDYHHHHHHHRLSLQINRDNTSEEEYFAEKTTAAARRGRRVTQDENVMSPGHYAKQVVKHVREKVSRRVVGADITNTTGRNGRDDENLIPLKKSPRFSSRFEGETEIVTADHVRDSNSPRLKFSDTNNNKSNNKSPRSVPSSSDTNHNHNNKQQHKENENAVVIVSGGKCSSSSSSSRVKKMMPRQASDHTIKNKKDEVFVHSTTAMNKSKKASFLSSEVLHISSPTLVQIKRDPSPPPTKLPLKQVKLQKQVLSDAPSSEKSTQLSSKPSHSYNQPDNIIFSRLTENVRHIPDCATPLRGGAVTEYRDYIHIILQRAGIINNPLNLPKWCTPSHPIDPSIFHHVELFHPTTTVTGGNSILSHRCNRKLIFQLVNELLGEITRPRFVIRPSISQICEDSQFRLVDELCKRIDDFPAANCLVLEDIDSLIDRDLRQPQLNWRVEEEEKESIVCEIEGEIMEWLVRETVVAMGWRRRSQPNRE